MRSALRFLRSNPFDSEISESRVRSQGPEVPDRLAFLDCDYDESTSSARAEVMEERPTMKMILSEPRSPLGAMLLVTDEHGHVRALEFLLPAEPQAHHPGEEPSVATVGSPGRATSELIKIPEPVIIDGTRLMQRSSHEDRAHRDPPRQLTRASSLAAGLAGGAGIAGGWR